MPNLFQAFSSVLLSPASSVTDWVPPSSLEWMPAGEHVIHGSSGGKAAEIRCLCTEEDARRLDEQLQSLLQKAATGEQSRPFIDKNHENGEAMAIPTRFFWQDGIRLAVEWTSAGLEALKGRVFSYFSPEWYHGEDNHPSAIPEVGPLGALTNTPAFQTIERLAAQRISEGGTSATTNQNTRTSMEQTMKVLVEAKVIPSAKLDDAEAAVLAKASLVLLAETHAEQLKAKDDEIAALKTERDNARKSEAESIVADAVKAGKIKDDATLRGTWVSTLLKDKESATAMLNGIDVKRKSTAGREPLDEEGEGDNKEKEINRLQASLKTEHDPMKKGQICLELKNLRNGEAKN